MENFLNNLNGSLEEKEGDTMSLIGSQPTEMVAELEMLLKKGKKIKQTKIDVYPVCALKQFTNTSDFAR